MKTIIKLLVICLFFSSCDPASNMEANIENLTSETLIVDFISFNANDRKTLTINANQTVLFQDGFDVGGSFLQPSLSEFDSIVVKNLSQEVLKIYKADDIDKNIYNINNWVISEPEKRFYKYKFEIKNEDLQ